MTAWLKESPAVGHAVSGKALQLEARRIDVTATFKASNDWFGELQGTPRTLHQTRGFDWAEAAQGRRPET